MTINNIFSVPKTKVDYIEIEIEMLSKWWARTVQHLKYTTLRMSENNKYYH